MESSPFDLRVTITDAQASADWNTLWQRLLAPLPTEAAPPPKEWPSAHVGKRGEGTGETSNGSDITTAIVAQEQGAHNG